MLLELFAACLSRCLSVLRHLVTLYIVVESNVRERCVIFIAANFVAFLLDVVLVMQ